MTPGSQQQRGGGCFSYGCLIALTIIIVMGGGVGYYLVHQVKRAVLEYSSEYAPAITPVPVVPEVSESARTKVQRIREALEAKSAFETEFSAEEVNAAIQQTDWRDKISVSLDGDRVRGAFSFPISAVGEWPAAKLLLGGAVSRKLNGAFAGGIQLVDGKVSISLSELTLNGHRLEDMAQGHASKWLSGAVNASEGDEGEGARETGTLRLIRRFEIRDSRLFIAVGPGR
jgi:hypothetical protein